jgi:hypothetical protein
MVPKIWEVEVRIPDGGKGDGASPHQHREPTPAQTPGATRTTSAAPKRCHGGTRGRAGPPTFSMPGSTPASHCHTRC